MDEPTYLHAGVEPALPYPLAATLAGWSARANRYPIFGKTWYKYRIRSFAAPLATLALVLVALATVVPRTMIGPHHLRFYLMFAGLWVVVAVALILGRTLAVLVRGRNWQPRRETIGITCALLFGMLVTLALTPFVQTGPQSGTDHRESAREASEAQVNRLVSFVIWIPVVAWLGGPVDMIAYFRQRHLLREAHLQAQANRYRDQRNEIEAHLAILSSQVEPHFLFNTLAGVRAAISSDPLRGIVMIDHLTDYLRATIPQLRKDRANTFVTLGSQIDAVKAYLGVIKARMPRLAVHVDCSPLLRGVEIPPLMLISLVENAIKHGVEPKSGAAYIGIVAACHNADNVTTLTLTVSDDGVGFVQATGSGIGLANIRERLKYLYEGTASLALSTREGGGVIATIMLPVTPLPEGTI
jgi:signal transduction histidine kinase